MLLWLWTPKSAQSVFDSIKFNIKYQIWINSRCCWQKWVDVHRDEIFDLIIGLDALKRMGRTQKHFCTPLGILQLQSWFCFLFALQWICAHASIHTFFLHTVLPDWCGVERRLQTVRALCESTFWCLGNMAVESKTAQGQQTLVHDLGRVQMSGLRKTMMLDWNQIYCSSPVQALISCTYWHVVMSVITFRL